MIHLNWVQAKLLYLMNLNKKYYPIILSLRFVYPFCFHPRLPYIDDFM